MPAVPVCVLQTLTLILTLTPTLTIYIHIHIHGHLGLTGCRNSVWCVCRRAAFGVASVRQPGLRLHRAGCVQSRDPGRLRDVPDQVPAGALRRLRRPGQHLHRYTASHLLTHSLIYLLVYLLTVYVLSVRALNVCMSVLIFWVAR